MKATSPVVTIRDDGLFQQLISAQMKDAFSGKFTYQGRFLEQTHVSRTANLAKCRFVDAFLVRQLTKRHERPFVR